MKISKQIWATLCLLFLVSAGRAQESSSPVRVRYRHMIGTTFNYISPQFNYEFRWSRRHSTQVSALWKWETDSPGDYPTIFDISTKDYARGLQLDMRQSMMLWLPDSSRFSGFILSGLAGISWNRALRYDPILWRYTRVHMGVELGYRWELFYTKRMLLSVSAGTVYRIPLLNVPSWFREARGFPIRMHGFSNRMRGWLFSSTVEIAIPLGRNGR